MHQAAYLCFSKRLSQPLKSTYEKLWT